MNYIKNNIKKKFHMKAKMMHALNWKKKAQEMLERIKIVLLKLWEINLP